MATKKVESSGSSTYRTGAGSRVAGPIPIGIPPLLRRFWGFAREMAQRFNKQLMKDHEEEFIKAVKRDLEKP